MPEPTLYLFDGHNLFHAGNYEDLRQLRDELASFVHHDWRQINPKRAAWIERFNKEVAK